jgi:hypothetical protein
MDFTVETIVAFGTHHEHSAVSTQLLSGIPKRKRGIHTFLNAPE